MWDISSLIRDLIHAPCNGSEEPCPLDLQWKQGVLTTGLPVNSLKHINRASFVVLNHFSFFLSLKLFISPLGRGTACQVGYSWLLSFCHLSLGLYHDTPFWPTKLLLKIQLIPLWRCLCILLTAFLMLLLKFSLPFIFVILIKNFFFFLTALGSLWDLSFLTRDWTPDHNSENPES